MEVIHISYASQREDIGYIVFLESIIRSKGEYTRQEKKEAREELEHFREMNGYDKKNYPYEKCVEFLKNERW